MFVHRPHDSFNSNYVAMDTDFGTIAITDEKARGDQREGQEQYTIQLDVINKDLDNFRILLANGTTYNVAELVDCLRNFWEREVRQQVRVDVSDIQEGRTR